MGLDVMYSLCEKPDEDKTTNRSHKLNVDVEHLTS